MRQLQLLLLCALSAPVSAMADDFVPTSFAVAHVAAIPAPDPGILTSNLYLDLSTDKACYAPGQSVHFTASQRVADATVSYWHNGAVVDRHPMSSSAWTWTPPADDFRGYLVEITRDADRGRQVLGTIAVDVSSDWTRFPRYGFVATFDSSKLAGTTIKDEMAYLNRCHINGVQFQDWHWKHHWPLGGTRDNPLQTYTDIANRWVNADVIRRYIDTQHSYGMKSIFYNLAFGALKDAEADGVDPSMFIFRDNHRGERDYHGLPDGWKSNIYLTNPGNYYWIEWIKERNDDVYHNLDFDGYQIDQLGYRGTLYDYWGKEVNLPAGYAAFINGMKDRHPDKRLIMNAVSSYGAPEILGTGRVDFAYNETWDSERYYSNLRDIIADNDRLSNHGVRTVFASYLNYNKAGSGSGEMNTPGVLLTDAVMFAIGGDHLELGDHMLSREYFPSSTLSMPAELRAAMIRYYDFMTAYENLLRDTDTSSEIYVNINSSDNSLDFNNWPPQTGTVTVYGRHVGNRNVCHLLNFLNADNVEWCDTDGTRPRPEEIRNVSVRLDTGGPASRIWVASPDYHGGAALDLPFTLEGNVASFVLPALKYWTMVVIEY